MNEFLKGTYKLDNAPKAESKGKKKDVLDEFEAKAIEKLGGSIAFVSKSKLLWSGENEKEVK